MIISIKILPSEGRTYMLVRSPYEKGYYSAEDATLVLGQNLEEANSTAAKGAEMYVGCEGYYAARSRRV